MIGRRATDLSDGTVTLREIESGDAADLYHWRMDCRSRTMFRSTAAVAYETHLRVVRDYFRTTNRDHWFIIEVDGVGVGAVVFYDFDSKEEECEWGRLVIAPKRRSASYKHRALALLIEHAKKFGVRRLRCKVLKANAGALKIYRRVGFAAIGEYQDRQRTFVQMALDLGVGK